MKLTLSQHAENLIAAIEQAAAEHGRPNSFSFAELHLFYGGPPPMIAGRAARTQTMPAGVEIQDGSVCVIELERVDDKVYEKAIRIVAVGADQARDFAVNFLGLPPDRIEAIRDGGPAGQPERYKPEARTWLVALSDLG